MSDIPEDVMKRAEAVLDEVRNTSSDAEFVEAIARALMEERAAERERCAKIIDSHYDNPRYTEWAYLTACADNRAAIRGQP